MLSDCGGKNIVRDCYSEPDLSLDTVCSKLGVSNSYFHPCLKGVRKFVYNISDGLQDAAGGKAAAGNRREKL